MTAKKRINPLYEALDHRVFPRIIGYATHRLHILGLLTLWLALLACGSWSAFELVGGNYTNGLSAIASCIVLLQQIHHHRETHEKIDSLHQKIDAIASPTAKDGGTITEGHAQ